MLEPCACAAPPADRLGAAGELPDGRRPPLRFPSAPRAADLNAVLRPRPRTDKAPLGSQRERTVRSLEPTPPTLCAHDLDAPPGSVLKRREPLTPREKPPVHRADDMVRPVERAGELREVHERMRARFLEQPYFRRFATRVAQVRDPP